MFCPGKYCRCADEAKIYGYDPPQRSKFFYGANQQIKVALSDVLQRVRGEYHKCQLGFTPALKDMDICVAEQYDSADDYRLFYLGKELKSIEKENLYFPEFSHA